MLDELMSRGVTVIATACASRLARDAEELHLPKLLLAVRGIELVCLVES